MSRHRTLWLLRDASTIPDPAARAGSFRWAVGIEDTFIPQVAASSGRSLDEYVLTQHDRFWREDLARIGDLGVRYLRYGIPWYRVNPAPGRFDWSWTDDVFPELHRLGIHPIVDLVHYGAPLWLDGTFLSPSYPDRVAEYAAAVAERYGNLVRLWTPLNEPRVHAHFAGNTGAWPPYRRGSRGYAQVMVALARGMSRTIAAIRRVRADAVIVHVDALSAGHTADPALQAEVDRSRHHGFMAQELVEGLIGPESPTWSWMLANGVQQSHLEELRAAPARIDVFGANFYTQMSGFEITGTPGQPVHRRRLATAADLGAVLREAHERTGKPVMLTETSLVGTVASRRRWLEASVDVVRDLREDGIPVIGYTWFPAFSLVTWAYRRGKRPMEAYLTHMGLWNLRGDGEGTLIREPTGLEGRYAELARSGTAAVGEDRVPVGRDSDRDYDQEVPAREIA